jgi:hypothetical protein
MTIDSSVFAGSSMSLIKKRCESGLPEGSSLGAFELLPEEIRNEIASNLSSKNIEDCCEAIERIQDLEQCDQKNKHNGIIYTFCWGRSDFYRDNSRNVDVLRSCIFRVRSADRSWFNKETMFVLPVEDESSLQPYTMLKLSNMMNIGTREFFNLFAFSSDFSHFAAVRQQNYRDIKRPDRCLNKNAFYIFDRRNEMKNLYKFDSFNGFFDRWDIKTIAISSDGLVALAGNNGICVFRSPEDLRILQDIEVDEGYIKIDEGYRNDFSYENVEFNKQGTTLFARVSDNTSGRNLPVHDIKFDDNGKSYELYEVDDEPYVKNKKVFASYLRENLICTGRSSQKQLSIDNID